MAGKIEQFIDLVQQGIANLDDPALFHEVLRSAVASLSIGDDEGARMFDVSRPTFNRWRNQVTTPRPVVRRLVYATLLTRAKKNLKLQNRSVATRPAGGGRRAPVAAPMSASGRGR